MKTITYRNLKNIDMANFCKEVEGRLQTLPDTNDILCKVKGYNTILSELVDEVAPTKTRKVKLVSEAPWFDAEFAELRKRRRKAEKKYRKSGLDNDRRVYLSCRKDTMRSYFDEKKTLIPHRLKNGSCKILYSTVNQLIDNNKKEIV